VRIDRIATRRFAGSALVPASPPPCNVEDVRAASAIGSFGLAPRAEKGRGARVEGRKNTRPSTLTVVRHICAHKRDALAGRDRRKCLWDKQKRFFLRDVIFSDLALHFVRARRTDDRSGPREVIYAIGPWGGTIVLYRRNDTTCTRRTRVNGAIIFTQ